MPKRYNQNLSTHDMQRANRLMGECSGCLFYKDCPIKDSLDAVYDKAESNISMESVVELQQFWNYFTDTVGNCKQLKKLQEVDDKRLHEYVMSHREEM